MEQKQLNGKEWLQVFIVWILIIGGVFIWYYKSNQDFLIDRAKSDMLYTLQKYSTTQLTVDDYDIDKVEIEKTCEIYKVKVNKSNYMKTGYFYVALIKPTGSGTQEILINDSLSELKETIYN